MEELNSNYMMLGESGNYKFVVKANDNLTLVSKLMEYDGEPWFAETPYIKAHKELSRIKELTELSNLVSKEETLKHHHYDNLGNHKPYLQSYVDIDLKDKNYSQTLNVVNPGNINATGINEYLNLRFQDDKEAKEYSDYIKARYSYIYNCPYSKIYYKKSMLSALDITKKIKCYHIEFEYIQGKGIEDLIYIDELETNILEDSTDIGNLHINKLIIPEDGYLFIYKLKSLSYIGQIIGDMNHLFVYRFNDTIHVGEDIITRRIGNPIFKQYKAYFPCQFYSELSACTEYVRKLNMELADNINEAKLLVTHDLKGKLFYQKTYPDKIVLTEEEWYGYAISVMEDKKYA